MAVLMFVVKWRESKAQPAYNFIQEQNEPRSDVVVFTYPLLWLFQMNYF